MAKEVLEERSQDWSMVEEEVVQASQSKLLNAERNNGTHNSLSARIKKGLGSWKSFSSNSLSSHFTTSTSLSTLDSLNELPTPVTPIYPPVPSKLDFATEDQQEGKEEEDQEEDEERPAIRLITPRTRRSSIGSITLSASPRKPIKLDLHDLPPVPVLPETFRNGTFPPPPDHNIPFIFGSPVQKPVTNQDFTKATEKVLEEMSKRMGVEKGSLNGNGMVGKLFNGLSRSASVISGRSQVTTSTSLGNDTSPGESLQDKSSKPKGLEASRFENLHEKEFEKMPSIANHPSLNRFNQSGVKRQVSDSSDKSSDSRAAPSFKRLRLATPTLALPNMIDNRIDSALRAEGWYEDSVMALPNEDGNEERARAERITKLRADRRTTLESRRQSVVHSARRKSVGKKLPKKPVTRRLLQSLKQASQAVTITPSPRDTWLLGRPIMASQRTVSNSSSGSTSVQREFSVKGRKTFDLQASLARGTKYKPTSFRHPCDNSIPVPLKVRPEDGMNRSVSAQTVIRSSSHTEISNLVRTDSHSDANLPNRPVLTNLTTNIFETLPTTSTPPRPVLRKPQINLDQVKSKIKSRQVNTNSGLRLSPRKHSPTKIKSPAKVKSSLQRGGGLNSTNIKIVNGVAVKGSPIKREELPMKFLAEDILEEIEEMVN